MGKIFGISDLPASTPMTPFEPVFVPQPERTVVKKPYVKPTMDVFTPETLPKKKTQSFLSMRNGIGKLMKSFSKKIVK
jgi:hypothetical protein